MDAKMLYENEHRIGADKCSENARELQNQLINQYSTFNYWNTSGLQCGEEVKKVREFGADNYRFFKEGYGTATACVIDTDSKLRNDSQWTSDRSKEQLSTRLFKDVPNLAKGGFNPYIDSRLSQGEYTGGKKKSCDVLAEASLYDRQITPLIPCLNDTVQDTAHIIQPWTWGGENTRDTVRQKQFLQTQGYVFDGKTWVKNRGGCKGRMDHP